MGEPAAASVEAPDSQLQFVARQPIFDRALKVVAYELLFRDGPHNGFPLAGNAQACERVIHDALGVFGLDALSGGKRLFINVSPQVLLSGLVEALPASLTTVELLETVEPSPEALAATRRLKDAGYQLALDDFVFRPGYEPLVELADVIKVDFLQTRGDERQAVVQRFRANARRFLAEKIETAQEQADAVRCGYELFQGFFFARPQMVSVRQLPASRLNQLRLIQQAANPTLDFNALEAVIKHDASLSVKLLRYLNSAFFGWRQQVTTIRQAITLLGERPFRRWVSVVALGGLAENVPGEVLIASLIRARFCELLGPRIGSPPNDLQVFLAGLLSLVDVMVGRPLAEALDQLAITGVLREALLTRAGKLGQLLGLAIAFEQGDWAAIAAGARALGAAEFTVGSAYRDAVQWADQTPIGER